MHVFLAESYLHDLTDVAIPIRGNFGIRWYALAYLSGFLIGWRFFLWMTRSGRSPMKASSIGDFMVYMMAGVMLGGRLGYVLFYDPSLFIEFSGRLPFWKLLAINEGGMASHGGVAGVIIACIIFARRRGLSSLHVLDMSALACTAGLFLGRLANFVNGELWGDPLPERMQADPPWWSIKYPREIPEFWTYEKPEFSERLAALEPLRDVVKPGSQFLNHVSDAARAGDQVVVDTVTPLLTPYYPSQLLQALTDGPLLAGLLVLIWWKPRKPGVVGAWFLLGYGVMRILTEFVRQPDDGVEVYLGLSRGQALSVLMIIAGAIAIPLCARRPVDPLGGLASRYARPVETEPSS